MCALTLSELIPVVQVHKCKVYADMAWAQAEALGYRLVSLQPWGRRGKWRLVLDYPD